MLFRSRGAGVDDDAKEILAQQVNDQVVDYRALGGEKARIERLAGLLQLVDVVRERVVQKLAGARSFEVDDLHVRDRKSVV